MTKFKVPGKILVASLWYLTYDARKLADVQLSLGKRTRSDSCFGNNRMPKRRKWAVQATVNNETYFGFEVEEDDFEFQSPLRTSDEEDLEEDEHVDAKAMKADDAKDSEHLWNDRITEKLKLIWKGERNWGESGNNHETRIVLSNHL